jgi:phenylacetate-CoA ligase
MASNNWGKIYSASPIWFQNLMVSIKGLNFRYQRNSDRILQERYQSLLKSERWSGEQFRDYQSEQLRQLLSIAFKDVPYYRDLQKKLGCYPEDFKKPEDVLLLPTLEKSIVRGNEKMFLNETVDLKKCYKGSTSGTTGTPMITYASQEAFSKKAAFLARLRHWAGLPDPLYPRRVQFTGRHIVPPTQSPEKHIYWRRNIPGKSLLCSAFHISPATAEYYLKAIRDFNPELIDGFPSAMLIVARIGKRLGHTFPHPKALITTAETMLPTHREELENAFSCKVFNQYTATDPSCFWCDCEYGTMHDNPESGISEIIKSNGEPMEDGALGEVAFTAFYNPVMILIRYRLGDLAIKAKGEHCPCGREMPIMKSLEGRKEDILYFPDRGYITGTDLLKGLTDVIEAQIIQEDLGHIRILLVPGEGYRPEKELELLENIGFEASKSVKVTVEKVAHVPRELSGKIRPIISKVKHLYPDDMRLYD